jgi:hypothetical protein
VNVVAGGIADPPCHWGHVNTGTLSSSLESGRKAKNFALKTIFVSEFKEGKMGSDAIE